jgi:hypothetical protein
VWIIKIPITNDGYITHSIIRLPSTVPREQVVSYAMETYKCIFSAVFGRELTLQDITTGKVSLPIVEEELSGSPIPKRGPKAKRKK